MAQFSRLDVLNTMIDFGALPLDTHHANRGHRGDRGSIASWFRAGASCIGMGSQLFRENLIAAGDFAGITGQAKNILGWIRKVRSEM